MKRISDVPIDDIEKQYGIKWVDFIDAIDVDKINHSDGEQFLLDIEYKCQTLQLEACEKEHDAVVRGLIQEIENLSPSIVIGNDAAPTTGGFPGVDRQDTMFPCIKLKDWQALKQKYGGEK